MNSKGEHMLKITLSPVAKEKLAALLAQDDDYAEPALRIRSVVAGTG